jgi:hypothetical protein
VELAVLAARIDARRQLVEERAIPLATDERRGEHARVDARHPGAQAAGEHPIGQLARRNAPDGKERRQPRARQPILAVAADVFEKQIAEGGMREAIGDRGCDSLPHPRLVHLVRARVRNRHHAERQPGSHRLRFEHTAPYRMHGDPIDRLVHRRQQRTDRSGMGVVEHMQRPRAVLARAPRQQNLHRNASGCSAMANASVARPTRGPGTTR